MTAGGGDRATLALLASLRAGDGPVSGEELARQLGCTRTAVWKRIAALRAEGYEIPGRPTAGYTLTATPDRLGPAELAPHLTGTWRAVHWLAEVDSTQRVARELARARAGEGTVVIAETQHAGRGRLGRTWHSPPGVNLYCSLVLRPALAPAAVPQLALVAGVAVAVAVEETIGEPAGIKWPNDVLLRGRKVAGVLTEMEAEMERVHHVIVGIGVNLNAPATSFPRDLRQKAGSLRSVTGRPVDRAQFTARLLAALEQQYVRYLAGGCAAVRGEWEAYSVLTGREVQVVTADGEIAGRVLGMDDDGALRVVTATGDARVVAGEVTLRGAYERPPGGRR